MSYLDGQNGKALRRYAERVLDALAYAPASGELELVFPNGEILRGAFGPFEAPVHGIKLWITLDEEQILHICNTATAGRISGETRR